MEIQLEERNRAHRAADRNVCLVVYRSVHDPAAGVCTRYPASRCHWAGAIAYRHGRRRSVQRRAHRFRWRSLAEGHAYAGQRDPLWGFYRDVCGIALVLAVHGPDGHHWPVSCAFPRACTNSHPILLSYRIPRSDHGYLPHESGRTDRRSHALRSAVITYRGSVDGSINGRGWCADHGGDLARSAGCEVYPITVKQGGSQLGFFGLASGPRHCDACHSRNKWQCRVATSQSTETSLLPAAKTSAGSRSLYPKGALEAQTGSGKVA